MTGEEPSLPIIDVSHLCKKYWNSNIDLKTLAADEEIQHLVQQLINGFQTWGFIYLSGHQIPQQMIESCFKTSEEFFMLSEEEKMQFYRSDDDFFGYVPQNCENFDVTRPVDIKEAFDMLFNTKHEERFKSKHPDLYKTLQDLSGMLCRLTQLLLYLFDIALGITDSPFLINQHQFISLDNYEKNVTSLRTLYYPPVADRSQVSEGQQRCTEHCDYGTVTLLLQDAAGGLEVRLFFFFLVRPVTHAMISNYSTVVFYVFDQDF